MRGQRGHRQRALHGLRRGRRVPSRSYGFKPDPYPLTPPEEGGTLTSHVRGGGVSEPKPGSEGGTSERSPGLPGGGAAELAVARMFGAAARSADLVLLEKNLQAAHG